MKKKNKLKLTQHLNIEKPKLEEKMAKEKEEEILAGRKCSLFFTFGFIIHDEISIS